MTTTTSTGRKCSYCDKSDSEIVRIIIPDTMVDGYFCRQCISIVADNAKSKDKAKQRERS
jgi:hypothetical protein